MKIEIKELDKDRKKFDPINITINVRIDTEEELSQLREEFAVGEFVEFSTEYSTVLFEYIDKLRIWLSER